MDPGLVREGVGSDYRLRRGDRHADYVAQKSAGFINLASVDVRVSVVEVPAGSQCHNDLFEARIARTFADAVDRTLDLSRAGLDTREGVRDTHSQIIMAMYGDVYAVDALDMFAQVSDQLAHLLRR